MTPHVPTTEDHLRAVIDAWRSFEDDASGWESRCEEAVTAAERHLSPRLDLEGEG